MPVNITQSIYAHAKRKIMCDNVRLNIVFQEYFFSKELIDKMS